MAYLFNSVFAGIAVAASMRSSDSVFHYLQASGVINFAQGELLLVEHILLSGSVEWHMASCQHSFSHRRHRSDWFNSLSASSCGVWLARPSSPFS